MNRRRILLYWTILLVPTLAIALAAARLLQHEQERIATQHARSVADRTQTMADIVRVAVHDVQSGLLEGLYDLASADQADRLREWQERNPLIRVAFISDPERGTTLPPTDGSATQDESRFLERYAPLLNGDVSWMAASRLQPSETTVPAAKPGAVRSSVSKSLYARAQMIKSAQYAAPAPTGQAGSLPDAADGWIAWFEGNRLGLVGWVRPPASDVVYGVEIEMSALISRLLTLFPEDEGGAVLALIDDGGMVAYQSGSVEVHPGTRPLATSSLAPELPHWEVRGYMPGESGAAAGRTFLTLGLIVLGSFVAAILSGGTLLTWQAVRNWRDAVRKTTFVSNVSHELKTPLTSIRMYAELLNERRVSDASKRAHYLEVIVSEAQRLTRLVNNMLDFSRIEQGRKRYRLEPLDLTAFIREFADNQKPRLRESGMQLAVKFPGGPVPLTTDRDALEQTLLNLLDNAAKYARDGAEVALELEADDATVRLRVMDRGSGIPEAHRDRIFQKFHRVDDSLTAAQPGSGLGLSIARSLVRGMNGELSYRPREGGGSIFIVELYRSNTKGNR